MGYGDYAPPSGHHSKKPLTKAQIKKLQQAYAQAGAISEEILKLETKEQKEVAGETESLLKFL